MQLSSLYARVSSKILVALTTKKCWKSKLPLEITFICLLGMNPVKVTAQTAPSITCPTDFTVCQNAAGGACDFTV